MTCCPLMRQHPGPSDGLSAGAGGTAAAPRPAEPPGPAADRWGASCHGASDPAGFPAGPAGGPADPRTDGPGAQHHSRTQPQRRSACRQKSLHCWTLRSPSRNARPGWDRLIRSGSKTETNETQMLCCVSKSERFTNLIKNGLRLRLNADCHSGSFW